MCGITVTVEHLCDTEKRKTEERQYCFVTRG